MFSNERDLEYNISDILNTPLFEEDFNSLDEARDSENSLLQGSTLRTATAFGRTATVKPGEDIRPALNSLKQAGGGTLVLLAGTHRPTYSIIGDSKINIIGEGADQTIVEFNEGTYNVNYTGTSSSDLVEDFYIKNLTIQNSNATYGLDITFASKFYLENIIITSCNNSGLGLRGIRNALINNLQTTSNTSHGVYITRATGFNTENFSFHNCIFLSNGAKGFYLSAGAVFGVIDGTIFNCLAESNTGDGFYCESTANNLIRSSFINCRADSNGDNGFALDVYSQTVFFTSCVANDNTSFGFELLSDNWGIVGGYSYDDVSLAGSGAAVAFASSPGEITVDNDVYNIITQNPSPFPKETRVSSRRTNSTGGSLTIGSVVVTGVSTSGKSVTTTTTQGDDKVLGVNGVTVADNTDAYILVGGFTPHLKVDGTTDIAVGDFLGTFTSAGIAMKAASGDMAFAIALEAYTTDDSNGVIDALIIKPRKL